MSKLPQKKQFWKFLSSSLRTPNISWISLEISVKVDVKKQLLAEVDITEENTKEGDDEKCSVKSEKITRSVSTLHVKICFSGLNITEQQSLAKCKENHDSIQFPNLETEKWSKKEKKNFNEFQANLGYITRMKWTYKQTKKHTHKDSLV